MLRSDSCEGKKAFPSYWAAARSVKALNKYRDGARVHPYRCNGCGFWHAGGEIKIKKNLHARKVDKQRLRRRY